MKISLLAVLTLAFVFTGCSSTAARKTIDLTHYKHVYVEQRLADNHHLAEQIAAELKARGYDATSGVLTMKPDGVDAIISYDDRWTWDFKTYLIEFNLYVRDVRAEKQVGQGYYHQAALITKSPQEIIRKVLDDLFKAA